jgi:transcriptional regulator with XRE-family HTH domain
MPARMAPGTMRATPLSAAIGERMRQLREERGLRQEDVAQAARQLGYRWTRVAVAQLESGQRRLSAAEFLSLPDMLNFATQTQAALFERHRAVVELADLVPDGGWIALTHENRTQARALRLLLRGHLSEVRTTDRDIPLQRHLNAEGERTFAGVVPPDRTLAERAEIQRAVWPDAPDLDVQEAAREAAGEAERKAATRLGVPAYAMALAARRQWHRSLTSERDRRVAERAPDGDELEEETDDPRRSQARLQAIRGHVTRSLLSELQQAFSWEFSDAHLVSSRSSRKRRRPDRHPRRTQLNAPPGAT